MKSTIALVVCLFAAVIPMIAAQAPERTPESSKELKSIPFSETQSLKAENFSLKMEKLETQQKLLNTEFQDFMRAGCEAAKIPTDRCRPDFQRKIFFETPPDPATTPQKSPAEKK